ncbi:thermonuclease family protein [Mammaliicoccus stepanovicii]|uniref:Thermonuclease n=1 Tax=Mammaliicoccus stepanovicii TaxID=643214 RepID=A0A239ZE86_9STAP|nr:thermonuclease family protein [Mammaliicoccus stepanovicii]PNZ74977.1 DNA-binding protein [Mammaliicoccus stepanovicii]GGI42004.1 SPBc2 prophage-derived endonuclease YokF [Mammaliicoccus stepanovicii]SNV68964.1 thermonuclease [Mammaliicoccus stepanovicii]
MLYKQPKTRRGRKTIFIISIFIIIALINIFTYNEDDTTNHESTKEVSHHQQKDKPKKTNIKPVKSTSTENHTASIHKEKKIEKSTEEHKATPSPVDNQEEKSHTYRPGTTDRIPVTLSKTVDGDTARFIINDKEESFRFLLIDTPETKHPRLGKQPFGEEASNRTSSLLQNATNIEVEYDVGQRKDKYQRHLVYVYVDGEMLNNILVREGLAKVAYVYPPNTRYLDELELSQSKAKQENLGIWSLGSVFEDSNSNVSSSQNQDASQDINSIPETNIQNSTQESSSPIEHYPNCTALRSVYPNGVPSTHPAYEPKHDRDKDNFACEKN